MAKKRYIQAINEALHEEMARDPRVIVFGEDVELSIMGDMRGLFDQFGPDRIRNTPISEASLTGMAVGAAAAGYRVVLHMMFANFIYTGMDAIANQMAKLRFMTGGQISLPVTVIAGYGGGRSTAAQHSDTPYPVLMNMGGLNVLTPANAADAKGLLKQAIRGNDPSIFFEAAGRGGEMFEIPDGDHVTPFGQARVMSAGNDITIVAIGTMVKPASIAVKRLHAAGINVELIDPRTLVPLDEQAILKSVSKTGRLIIVDEARDTCSASSHIAAVISEKAFGMLRAPIGRVTMPDVAMPYAPNVEKILLPDADRIERACRNSIEYSLNG